MDMITEEVKPKKKWQYVPGKNVRSHIAKWEAEDFAGQNAKFGGDAVGAKAKELQNLLGEDIGKRLTTKELDGLLATYYNLSPDSFKRVILPAVKEYAMDPTVLNSNRLYDTMMNRYKIAPAKYLKGIKRRAAADIGLMGILRSEPMMLEQTADGGKILTVDPSVYGLEKPGFESTWKPILPIKTDYNLNNPTPQSISAWNGADAPNTTPRLKDFLEVRQEDLNRGVDIYGDPISPFSLRLRLPSLTSMLLVNTPLKQAEQYFADVLGISSMIPEGPSLFPRLKNGKLPGFEDGTTQGGWVREKNGNPIKFNEDTGALTDLITGETGSMRVPEITISPDQNDPYRDSRIREGQYADDSWHRNWLSLRQLLFDNNVDLNRKKFKKNGTDTIEGQLGNLSSSTEFSRSTAKFYDQTGKRDLFYWHEGEPGLVAPRTDGTLGNSIWYHKRYSGVPYDPLTEFDQLNTPMTLDELDKWNRKQGYDLVSPEDIDAARIRQRTKALNPWTDKPDKFGNALPQHEAIKKINKRHKIGDVDAEKAYLDLMETRFRLGLSPDHVVTKEEILLWKKDFKMAPLFNTMDDDVLLEYFNDVASNPNPLFDPNAILYSFGPTNGKILYARDGKLPGYSNGKPIHIKPANRGKLTRLKKRTGKSEAELYRTGSAATRKMITFARNARKWKH